MSSGRGSPSTSVAGHLRIPLSERPQAMHGQQGCLWVLGRRVLSFWPKARARKGIQGKMGSGRLLLLLFLLRVKFRARLDQCSKKHSAGKSGEMDWGINP